MGWGVDGLNLCEWLKGLGLPAKRQEATLDAPDKGCTCGLGRTCELHTCNCHMCNRHGPETINKFQWRASMNTLLNSSSIREKRSRFEVVEKSEDIQVEYGASLL